MRLPCTGPTAVLTNQRDSLEVLRLGSPFLTFYDYPRENIRETLTHIPNGISCFQGKLDVEYGLNATPSQVSAIAQKEGRTANPIPKMSPQGSQGPLQVCKVILLTHVLGTLASALSLFLKLYMYTFLLFWHSLGKCYIKSTTTS